MPIYAYRCEACGFSQDVLQKISDDTLTVCPSCEQDAFRKQVTAAGFQLKGSGWYVTDFRNGSGGTAKPAVVNGAAEGAKDGGGSNDSGKSGGDGASAPAAAAAPAAGASSASASQAPTSSSPAAATPSKPAA